AARKRYEAMANAPDARCRLCLVTPPAYEVEEFAPRLSGALSGGDVASLIVTSPDRSDPAALQRAAERLVPIAQARGVAALIHNDIRVAARAKADGVHIDTGLAAVRDAVEAARRRQIVGAGGAHLRHEALELGDVEPDYLF